MDFNKMTLKDIKNLKIPHRKWDENIGEFDSMIILPLKKIHDSGYSCMDFIAIKDDSPICFLSGCSDVIHIGGIYSNSEKRNNTSFSIDCLKKSKLLRLFCYDKMTCGVALSSFEVFESKKGDVI